MPLGMPKAEGGAQKERLPALLPATTPLLAGDGCQSSASLSLRSKKG